MTKRLIGWLLLLPLCVVLVIFALANRHVVTLKFDPFNLQPPLVPTIEVPLFMVIYVLLIIGILLGGVAAWFAQGEQRKQKRQWRNQAQRMEAERNEAKNLALENQSDPSQLFETN